jgi:hypothetical protein
MVDSSSAILAQLSRQIDHFSDAAARLADLSTIASATGWEALERDLRTAIRSVLGKSVDGLGLRANVLKAQLAAAETLAELRQVHRALIVFRRDYLSVEAVVGFFGDAVNTRTNTIIGWQLRALDVLAWTSLETALEPLGRRAPPVLTCLEKGLGAKILKAGLRLWDNRSRSPVAVISMVHHNLGIPTSLLHETGHEFAHLLGFVAELAATFEARLSSTNREIAALWSGWASEVAGDAFAFAHAGFAAVAALHDVLADQPQRVTDVTSLDPHPAGWIRILLGVAMCRRFFGAGPWDAMEVAWRSLYPLDGLDAERLQLLRGSEAVLPTLVEIIFETPYRAFGGRAFVELVDPVRVRPDAILELERTAGAALYSSSVWIQRECVRLLALSGYRLATEVGRSAELLQVQRGWMQRLGDLALAA